MDAQFYQAYPISKALLTKLLNACGDDLRALRDRALLLVTYDSMRRLSKLIALRIEDIEWLSDKGAFIMLSRSKTDQHGYEKWLHFASETTIALQASRSAAQINDGFIFRVIRPSGMPTESLCETSVSRIYKKLATPTGLNREIVEQISGHSMHVGRAQAC